jgi:hypothetical protein
LCNFSDNGVAGIQQEILEKFIRFKLGEGGGTGKHQDNGEQFFWHA